MKSLNLLSAYFFLITAIIFGIASNSFLKTTEGFSKLSPTIFSIVTIIICIFCLSKAMTVIPIGFTYATYGSLTTIGVTVLALFKFNQMPNIYSIIGIILILIGVILVNYYGNLDS